VIVTACRIDGVHFIGPNGDDDARGDGIADSTGDSGPPMASTKGYLIDNTLGVWRVTKDMTGGLMLGGAAPVLSYPNAVSAATNRTGTMLYVFVDGGSGSNTGIANQYSIQANGALTDLQQPLQLNGCTPRYAALDPNGTKLALGCEQSNFMMFDVQADGRLGPPLKVNTPNTTGTPRRPAFSPDGACLYIADASAPASSDVYAYTVGAGAPSLVNSSTSFPNARGIVVDPMNKHVFVTGVQGVNGNVLVTLDIGNGCALFSDPIAPLPIGTSPVQVIIDPTGHYVFVTGMEVDAFTLDQATGMLGTVGTFLQNNNMPMDGAIMDPAVPDRLYITAQAYSGTHVTHVTNGVVTYQNENVTVGAGSAPRWLVLVP
jgi:DNA-binding beta-propeller fold protein YncE